MQQLIEDFLEAAASAEAAAERTNETNEGRKEGRKKGRPGLAPLFFPFSLDGSSSCYSSYSSQQKRGKGELEVEEEIRGSGRKRSKKKEENHAMDFKKCVYFCHKSQLILFGRLQYCSGDRWSAESTKGTMDLTAAEAILIGFPFRGSRGYQNILTSTGNAMSFFQ